MRDDIIEIICEINPLWDPDDEDMSIAEFLESKQLMELIVTLEDKYDIDIPSMAKYSTYSRGAEKNCKSQSLGVPSLCD